MTAPIVYVNAREVPLLEEDLTRHPQDGDTLATFRAIYRKHQGMGGDYADDMNGTLWERLAEHSEAEGREHRFCARLIYPGSLTEQPEYCDEEALSDSDFCAFHDDGADA